MRWLVTGGSGFIGWNLAARLARRREAVRALVRSPSRAAALADLGVELAPGDVTDAASLPRAVEGCDVVVHVAGLVKALDPSEYFRTNVEGTRHLARACAQARRAPRFVLVSSIAAAGPSPLERPRCEDDPPAPVSAYGRSKLEAEEALRALADRLRSTVVRPPMVYGPRDKELVPALARMARFGVVLKSGFSEKRYSIVHVDDLCDGIIAAAERGRTIEATGSAGTYFLSDGVVHTWHDIAREACAAVGTRARVFPLPETAGLVVAAASAIAAAVTRRPAMLSFDKMREMRQRAWTCSIHRARAELGFEPRVALAVGMRKSIESLLGRA